MSPEPAIARHAADEYGPLKNIKSGKPLDQGEVLTACVAETEAHFIFLCCNVNFHIPAELQL